MTNGTRNGKIKFKWVNFKSVHRKVQITLCFKSAVSNPRCVGCRWPKMTVNPAQHKIVNLLKTLWDFFVITCHNVFNVWPKTTLLPVWPRDGKSLDTPDLDDGKYYEWSHLHKIKNMYLIFLDIVLRSNNLYLIGTDFATWNVTHRKNLNCFRLSL